MSESAETREWHRIIRASVRECLETWALQAEAEPGTVEAMEAILARATVPILRQVEERQPETVQKCSRSFSDSSPLIAHAVGLTSDVGELTRTGYALHVCGATFERWVTPNAADRDLLRSGLMAFPN